MTNADLDVGRLRLLREVSLRGSISAAARELGLSPSAVSQQLAVLEREAGTSLVDRSPRGVSLTGAGRALAARAGEVLDVLARARADLDRLTGALGGPVALACVASAATALVSPAVRDLAADHPGVEVLVEVSEPSAALGLLVAGDVDIAIVDEYDSVPLALPDFVVSRDLCAEPLVLAVAPGWAGRRPAALRDLADADWVLPPVDAACGLAVRTACRAAGFEARSRWVSDDMLVLAHAVAAGHGVAILPRLSVATGTDGRDVEIVELTEPRLRRRLTAVARSSRLGRPSVAAVLAAVADRAAGLTQG